MSKSQHHCLKQIQMQIKNYIFIIKADLEDCGALED